MEKYKNGFNINDLKYLPELSEYNHNYYLAEDKVLIYAESDDDNTVEWFVIDGQITTYLGESYGIEEEIKLY